MVKKTKNRKGGSEPAIPLTSERIVLTALELINEDGLAAFSTRRLGEALGCEAMSIYHHFKSKQHLLDALVDHAISSVEVGESSDAERDLRACLHSYRSMARRLPGLFPLVATHRLNTAVGVRFIESVLRLIRRVQPDTEKAARQFRALGYYLVGACLDETSGYARGPSAAEPVGEEFIARECPNLMAAAPYFQEKHWDATFDYGVDALLQGTSTARKRKSTSRRGRGTAK